MNNTSSSLYLQKTAANWLIFTDLDGTLLDHHSYSFAPAEATLNALNALHIPVICSSSKTFAEIIPIRSSIKNRHPFIVENGAAIYLPLSFMPEKSIKSLEGATLRNGYWRFTLSQPRSHWLKLLAQMDHRFSNLYASFSELGDAGIAQATGLSLESAQLANEREFSEPLLWLGNEQSKTTFIHAMNQLGANVLQGGRFLHIVGNNDKGKAMHWLQQVYTSRAGHVFKTIAAGDGPNDIQMLELADFGLIVKSPINSAPPLNRTSGVLLSNRMGPAGWAEGISKILSL